MTLSDCLDSSAPTHVLSWAVIILVRSSGDEILGDVFSWMADSRVSSSRQTPKTQTHIQRKSSPTYMLPSFGS